MNHLLDARNKVNESEPDKERWPFSLLTTLTLVTQAVVTLRSYTTLKAGIINMDKEIGEEALEHMRTKGIQDGLWYAYENHAMDSSLLGHLKFLQVGPSCTFKWPPSRLPDNLAEINWMYMFIGRVDLDKGEINGIPYSEVAPPEVHGHESEDGGDSGNDSG
jgi:hypothetical protein